MSICNRCGKEIGLFEGLLSFNKITNRCRKCENDVLNIFNNFRHHFLEACYSGKISDHTILQFQNGIAQQNLSWDEALLFIQNDSFSLIERYLTSAETDGGISEPDANYIFKLQQLLRLPQINQSAFLERIQRLRFITNLRTGRLPSTVPSVHLDAGEICHLEIAATYTKVNLRSVKTIPGRFVITNKKLNFLSESGGWKILWNNIMRIERDSQSIYLELSTKTGNGRYFLKDPLLTR